MSHIKMLAKKQLIHPQGYVIEGLQYESMMGSVAYGVSDDTSDIDIYAITIPPEDIVFPHLTGEILGFDKQVTRFDQFQKHHIQTETKNYDITVYNIVKYFRLAADNNPNIIDSLFVPQRCVLHCTQIGDMIRSNRNLFLHKGAFYGFKGYAFSQIHKMTTKNPIGLEKLIGFEKKYSINHSTTVEDIKKEIKRRKTFVKGFQIMPIENLTDKQLLEYLDLFESCTKRGIETKVRGFSTKFAYHCVRLLLECEQILIEHTLDLERHREQLKAIRKGYWTQDRIIEFFNDKEKQLEELYVKSTLRHSPDEKAIKQLLLTCLEQYYGSLDNIGITNKDTNALIRDLELLISKYRKE